MNIFKLARAGLFLLTIAFIAVMIIAKSFGWMGIFITSVMAVAGVALFKAMPYTEEPDEDNGSSEILGLTIMFCIAFIFFNICLLANIQNETFTEDIIFAVLIHLTGIITVVIFLGLYFSRYIATPERIAMYEEKRCIYLKDCIASHTSNIHAEAANLLKAYNVDLDDLDRKLNSLESKQLKKILDALIKVKHIELYQTLKPLM